MNQFCIIFLNNSRGKKAELMKNIRKQGIFFICTFLAYYTSAIKIYLGSFILSEVYLWTASKLTKLLRAYRLSLFENGIILLLLWQSQNAYWYSRIWYSIVRIYQTEEGSFHIYTIWQLSPSFSDLFSTYLFTNNIYSLRRSIQGDSYT